MSALDKKISALNAATSLSPGDFLAVVQSGETKKVDFANLFSNQTATLASVQSDITNGTLIPGSVYYLTNVQVTQAETIQAKVLLQAVSNTQLSPNAIRFQLVPDYSVLSFWSAGGSYNIGDKVIWGSRVWENLNGNVGTAPSPLNLDSEWDEVPYVAGADYTEIAMSCKYDIVNDVIYEQEYLGIKIVTTLQAIQGYSFSACDYCDWGQQSQMTLCANNNLIYLPLLNNPFLNYFFNVEASGVINNDCDTIVNCKTISYKFIYDIGNDVAIADNRCQIIKNITNINYINNIPASVAEYSWVTDDESGYIELDLDANPLLIGTHVIGCILPIDVAICEVTMNCDGGLPGTTLTFGIDTDDPTHVSFTGANINAAPQRDTTISARTTAYSRELILDVSVADADSGKLWITYKYI